MKPLLSIFTYVFVLIVTTNLKAQKCYVLDFDNTIIQNTDGSKLDSSTYKQVQAQLRLKEKIYFNKEYVYLIENDSVVLILQHTDEVYTQKVDEEKPFVLKKSSKYAAFQSKDKYTLAEGPFTGNVTGKFCREYILKDLDDKEISYIVAVTIPFVNFLKLPAKLEGFPIQYEQTIEIDGNKKSCRLTYDVQKVKEPSFFSKAIAKFESDALGKSHKDDCPEAGMRFIQIEEKYIDKINELVLPYQARFTPPVNTFYEIPKLNGPVLSLEIREGDRLEKYVEYNQTFKPELIISCGYSSCDTTQLTITDKDQITSIHSTDKKQHIRNDTLFRGGFREAIYNDINTRLVTNYRTSFKSNKFTKKDLNAARKIERNHYKKMDVIQYGKDSLVTHQGIGSLDIREKVNQPEDCRKVLEYHFENKKLVNVYDVKKDEIEASLGYYDNGLLRSYHQPKYQKKKFTSTQCYSYTIKQLDFDHVEIHVTRDYLIGGPETTVYKLDHYGNIMYRGSPITHKNGQRRGIWYFIEYTDSNKKGEIPER